MSFLTFLAFQDSDAKKNIDGFSFAKASSIKRLSTDTMLEKLNLVVLEKSEFHHSSTSKLKRIHIQEFFWRKNSRNFYTFLNLFSFLVEIFWQDFQNCILRVQRMILGEQFFDKTNTIYFFPENNHKIFGL